jgi:hypothetical protein
MSLTVCLLTRNEEQALPRALKSVAPVASEVIVVDTGSTDRTVTVAAEHGAEVRPFAWDDDFAAGRNFALEQATGEWVLWLNPNEELLPAGCEALPDLLTRGDALAYAVQIQTMVQAARPDHVSETAEIRLFRRDVGLRYVGRLHPSFKVPAAELARRQGKKVYPADLTVRCHSYLSVLTPDKLRWAARLLEKELQDRPGQLHYLIEYGRNLLWQNDPRGHEVLAEASEQVLQHRDAPSAPSPTVASLLEYLLTVSPEQARSGITRAEAAGLAARWFRNSPPLLWALAQQHFRQGDYRSAAGLLEGLVRLGEAGAYDRALAFEPDIVGPSARLNLAACYAKLGVLEGAEECLRPLLDHPAYGAKAREYHDVVQRVREKQADSVVDGV